MGYLLILERLDRNTHSLDAFIRRKEKKRGGKKKKIIFSSIIQCQNMY